MSGRAPLVTTMTAVIPGTAQASDAVYVVGEAMFDGTVTMVSYTPVSDITGADTDSRSINVHNRGDDGDGTTEMASIDFVADTDAAQYDETLLTLSSTDGATDVSKGDIITVQSLHVGSGLADPGGTVQVEITRS